MTTVFAAPDDLLGAAGQHLGHSDWITVDQARIDTFAEATGDHQWIHVDPEAAAAGPFGATIAHGYLTLALTNLLLPQIVRVEGISMGVNYGVNRCASRGRCWSVRGCGPRRRSRPRRSCPVVRACRR